MEFKAHDPLMSSIKKKEFMPVYVLQGDEPFFIDILTAALEENVLTESEKAFNMSILYGRDVEAKQVLDHARQYPMMAQRRLVILKEAQFMRDLKSLQSYVVNPSPQTVLVIAHKKKIDGRIKWVKEAKKSNEVGFYTSNTVPEYKLTRWIQDYVRDEGLSIGHEATEMLSQYLGNDLKKVSNEISKIKLNLEGNKIEVHHIEKFIGISRDFDVYSLLKALSQGDVQRVHQITYNIEKNEKEQPLQKIIPGMAGYFERVIVVAQHFKKDDKTLGSLLGTYPNFVKEYRNAAKRFGYPGLIKAYEELVEADGMSKGLGRRNSKGILKELVGKLILLSN